MTRLFCCLFSGFMWVWIRRFVPAAWRLDYCEAPRLACGSEGCVPGWDAAMPAALVFALSPDIFAAFCLLNCAYTDALGHTVEDQWITALWLYGLALRASPAAFLPPAVWLLTAALSARLGQDVPVGMADAKLLSALALAFAPGILISASHSKTHIMPPVQCGSCCRF